MDTVLLSSILTGLAVFSLLMFVFEPWLFPPQPKLDAVRASVLSRERYERLVVAERPWWERFLSPLAARLGSAMPALASQVSERDIVRAGFDPATLTPAEVYAAKLVSGLAILGTGLALTPLFGFALIIAMPLAFVGYVFPTEYLGGLEPPGPSGPLGDRRLRHGDQFLCRPRRRRRGGRPRRARRAGCGAGPGP